MASRSTKGTAARRRRPLPLLAVTVSLALAAGVLGAIAGPAAAAGHAPSRAASAEGGSWQPQGLPASVAELNAVTCPVADTCLAVGQASGGGGVALETTDGGSLWSQLPLPSGAGDLTAVSCVSQNVCLAGGYGTGGGGIVLEQDTLGGGFVADPTFTSAQLGAMGYVIGISCVLGTSSCALLANQLPRHSDPMFGSTDVGGSGEAWEGPFYLPEAMDSTGAFVGLYSAVDCLAGGACYVVGETDTSGGSEIMAWSDDYWTTDAIDEAEPGNGGGTLPQDLSCGTSASLTECLVVGSAGGAGEDALFSCSSSSGIGCFWGNPTAPPSAYSPSAAYCLGSFTSGASLTCAAAAATAPGSGDDQHGVWGTSNAANAWVPEGTPADTGYVSQIGCSPSSFCVAVGEYTSGGGMLLVADDELLTDTAGPPGGPVPAPHMVGGACGCAAGEPVNVATGDFYETDTDVSVPSYGPALSFQRTYDASTAQGEESASTPGPLGYGWTFDYAEHLVVGSGGVTVIGAKGDATDFYTPTSSGGAPGCPQPYETDPSPSFAAGSYCAASYVDESLTHDADGAYVLVSHPGEEAVFDATGRLPPSTTRPPRSPRAAPPTRPPSGSPTTAPPPAAVTARRPPCRASSSPPPRGAASPSPGRRRATAGSSPPSSTRPGARPPSPTARRRRAPARRATSYRSPTRWAI